MEPAAADLRLADTTRAELEEALTNLNYAAKRSPRVVGSYPVLSQWDKRHAQIDALLTDWEQS